MRAGAAPVIAAGLLSLAWTATARVADAGAAESYAMVCRGGGAMRLQFDTTTPDMYVLFTAAPRAAGQQQPGPGQCAWVDRPLRPNEPRKLKYRAAAAPEITFEKRRGVQLGTILSLRQSPDALHFVRPLNEGELFYVRCRNAGSFLEVTRLGP